jgi:16S rRNA (guanine966-N2)-methyltransferase
MRIIAGQFKGRKIHQPHGNRTHPMSEKVRGAVFNALGDIKGLKVLDAFAGTGALSFEALSRGAEQVTAVDLDKKAAEAMRLSASELDVTNNIKIIKNNIRSWSNQNPQARFDLLLLDPPYDDLQITILFEKLIDQHVKKDGVVVLSYPGHDSAPKFKSNEVLNIKKYGDAQLVFYRKIS